jgi:hypothetical protein
MALIIDDSYGRLAEAYYLKFPAEPISAKASFQVDKPTFIKETSLATMLSSIPTDTKAGSDFVIVSHGNDDGLTMGLFHKHPKAARTDHLITLMGEESRDKKAEKLSLKPDLVDQLVAKMEVVRKIGLGHLAFRGCSIGSKKRNLVALKDLFGAKSVSATSLLSTFGFGKPMYFKDKKNFEAAWKKHAPSAHRFSGKSRVIFSTWKGKEPLTEITLLAFESEDGMLEWLQTHFVSGTTSGTATSLKNNVPLHWLSHKPPILPLDGTHKGQEGAIGYADFMRTSEDKDS